MAYELAVGGSTFRTDDLTLAEAAAIEKATETSWLFINPLRSAEHCRAVMVAFLSRDRSKAEAEKLVGSMSMKTAILAVTVVEEDLPEEYEDGVPKVGAGPPTATS